MCAVQAQRNTPKYQCNPHLVVDLERLHWNLFDTTGAHGVSYFLQHPVLRPVEATKNALDKTRRSRREGDCKDCHVLKNRLFSANRGLSRGMAHAVHTALDRVGPVRAGHDCSGSQGQASAWKGRKAMLVLTRKRDDVIRIGDNIVIRVIHTSRGSVKIGVEAPAEVRVVRGEVLARANQCDSATASVGTEAALLPH